MRYNKVLFSYIENNNLSFAAPWLELEVIMLSEITQTENCKPYIFSLICWDQ
jgi:hypothetical protein